MDLEDTKAVIDAHHSRAEEADAHAAHYTAWMMQPHTSKSIKPEKIRRIKPEKEGRTKAGDELSERRVRKATREELTESIRKMPKKTRRKSS